VVPSARDPPATARDLDQLWELAVAWYATRISPEARRPRPDEMRQIFARVGLLDSFWDPQADGFG
jgi:hypothetical protein